MWLFLVSEYVGPKLVKFDMLPLSQPHQYLHKARQSFREGISEDKILQMVLYIYLVVCHKLEAISITRL